LPLTQEKVMEKFAPFGMPLSLHCAFPLFDSSISTDPFFRVSVVQLENRGEWQLISAAGTPFSIRVIEFQLIPLAFVKYKVPDPLAGTVKLKFAPTPMHCGHFPLISSPPPPPAPPIRT